MGYSTLYNVSYTSGLVSPPFIFHGPGRIEVAQDVHASGTGCACHKHVQMCISSEVWSPKLQMQGPKPPVHVILAVLGTSWVRWWGMSTWGKGTKLWQEHQRHLSTGGNVLALLKCVLQRNKLGSICRIFWIYAEQCVSKHLTKSAHYVRQANLFKSKGTTGSERRDETRAAKTED